MLTLQKEMNTNNVAHNVIFYTTFSLSLLINNYLQFSSVQFSSAGHLQTASYSL